MEKPFGDGVCPICRLDMELEDTETWANVYQTGLESLIIFSRLREEKDLTTYLEGNPVGLKVHTECRKRYTSKRRFEQQMRAKTACETESKPAKRLRSTVSVTFDYKEHCLLCGESAEIDRKHPDRDKISRVETIEVRTTLLQHCEKRNDKWALDVKGRLNNCIDLVAVEAVYHRRCHAAFCALNPHPADCTHGVAGARVCEDKSETFETMCSWVELCDDELYSLDELQQKLMEIALGDEDRVYSKPQLKRKLEEKYGEHIFFSEVAGKRNVICFKNMASCVINEKWYGDRRTEIADESVRVVVAAAKLIKAQIREMVCDMDKYPLNAQFDDAESARKWVPTLLQAFMENVACDSVKQVALSHCIVQASRPRSVIAPILFGLGVSLDKEFASDVLLNRLSRLGLSISYDEVARYKQSALQSSNDDLPPKFPECFSQFSGDNVDHNGCTLDGYGGLHGMGIIIMSTPCTTEVDATVTGNKMVTVDDVEFKDVQSTDVDEVRSEDIMIEDIALNETVVGDSGVNEAQLEGSEVDVNTYANGITIIDSTVNANYVSGVHDDEVNVADTVVASPTAVCPKSGGIKYVVCI